MNNKLRFAMSVVLFAIIVILQVVVIGAWFKDDIIINAGIQAYNTLNVVMSVLQFISLIAVVLNLVLMLVWGPADEYKNKPKNGEENNKQNDEEPSKIKLRTPEGVLDYFMHMWSRFKEVNDVVLAITYHLNTMNDLQDRLHKIIELNDISALAQAENVLQSAEDAICNDYRTVINKYIACGLSDNSASQNDDDVKKFYEYAKPVVVRNSIRLEKAKGLVEAVAETANKTFKSSADETFDVLKVYIEALQNDIDEDENDDSDNTRNGQSSSGTSAGTGGINLTFGGH